MKGKKKIISILFILMTVLLMAGVTASAASKAKPSLNKKKVTISVGKTYQLKLKNNTKTVKWSSNNTKVATVSKKGKVTAKKAGKAVITAKTSNGSYKCTVTVKPVKKKLTSLTTDEKDFLVGSSVKVTFTVEASSSVTGPVKLYKNNKAVATMRDNGKKGDKKKGDGIYTCTIKVKRKTAGKNTYYAKAGKVKSSKVSLYFYNGASEADKQNIENISAQFDAISDKYEDPYGNIPAASKASAMSEVEAYVKKLYASGEVVRYEKNDSNIVCKLKSGLTVVYQPQVDGLDSIGADVSMSIVTMQPCLSTYSSSLNTYMRLPDNAANAIASEFSNYTFDSSNNLDNSEVSLERIRSISSNQVVIWHGHGGYSRSNHSFLVTGEDFNWNKWWFDVEYWWDCVQDRILQGSNGKAMFTSKYVDKYCGNMNNSLIYLAACQSGKDNVLANAFLNKGATAVVANSETIYTTYNTRMENAILTRMTTVNSSTSNYYTLGEALVAAKGQYGENDGSEYHAAPQIFGGNNAVNYRFGDVKPGRIEGQVCRADDRSTPIANASIKIYKDGSVVKSLVSDSRGRYEAELNPGDYQVNITADGYIGFICYASIETKRTKYMETFLMVDGLETDTGNVKGYINNSVTGDGVADVRLDIRKNWNNPSAGSIVSTVYTNSYGKYTADLPLGNYTITASKEGFITNSFNIVVLKNVSREQNGTISPVGYGDNYRIVLSWGENPRDLDSHVVGTLSDGSIFHTYFSRKNAMDGDRQVCNLDVDDTTSYGPETITLTVNNTTPYYYYIYKYAGYGDLSTSSAKVELFQGGTHIATYHVPTNQGNGDYWNVFAIIDGRVQVKNTITDGADLEYAGSNGAVNQQTRAAVYNSKGIAGTEKK